MTKESQIAIATNLRNDGAAQLNAWLMECNKNPMRAFEFFKSAMEANAKIHVGSLCLVALENNGTIKVLAERELIRLGSYAIRSTGILDSTIKEYVMEKWCMLLKQLEFEDD